MVVLMMSILHVPCVTAGAAVGAAAGGRRQTAQRHCLSHQEWRRRGYARGDAATACGRTTCHRLPERGITRIDLVHNHNIEELGVHARKHLNHHIQGTRSASTGACGANIPRIGAASSMAPSKTLRSCVRMTPCSCVQCTRWTNCRLRILQRLAPGVEGRRTSLDPLFAPCWSSRLAAQSMASSRARHRNKQE